MTSDQVSTLRLSRSDLIGATASVPAAWANVVGHRADLTLAVVERGFVGRFDLWVASAGLVLQSFDPDAEALRETTFFPGQAGAAAFARLVHVPEPAPASFGPDPFEVEFASVRSLLEAVRQGSPPLRGDERAFVLGRTGDPDWSSRRLTWVAGARTRWCWSHAGDPVELSGGSLAGLWSAISTLLHPRAV